jgi:hypothetical protein
MPSASPTATTYGALWVRFAVHVDEVVAPLALNLFACGLGPSAAPRGGLSPHVAHLGVCHKDVAHVGYRQLIAQCLRQTES